MQLWQVLLLALGSGLAATLGALFSSSEPINKSWKEIELDSFIASFGGGALLAAVAIVLVPFGMKHLDVAAACLSFLGGGLLALAIDYWSEKKKSSLSNLAGMLLDYVPEALSLGASAMLGSSAAYLLALLIGLQNFPEGFAAYHEMRQAGTSKKKLLLLFAFVPLCGPLAAWLGYEFFAHLEYGRGLIMLACAGAILFLIFQDIAPLAKLKKARLPSMGAVAGFALGMAGSMFIGH